VLGSVEEPPRVAFAVGRAVGGAVTRNQVRRRLRAALREHAPILEPGAGYLVRATQGAGQASYGDLSRTLRAILDDFSSRRS